MDWDFFYSSRKKWKFPLGSEEDVIEAVVWGWVLKKWIAVYQLKKGKGLALQGERATCVKDRGMDHFKYPRNDGNSGTAPWQREMDTARKALGTLL